MKGDQIGHGLMALVAAMLLLAAGLQLWLLRQPSDRGSVVLFWRAAAAAQGMCGLVVLAFSVAQIGAVSP